MCVCVCGEGVGSAYTTRQMDHIPMVAMFLRGQTKDGKFFFMLYSHIPPCLTYRHQYFDSCFNFDGVKQK